MASPAEIGQLLPDTLPEDFSEWDGESSLSAPAPDGSVLEASTGLEAVAIPSAPSAAPQPALARNVGEWDFEQPPLPPTIYRNHEALEGRLRAFADALKTEPISTSKEEESEGESNHASYPPLKNGSISADAVKSAPAPLPPAAKAEEDSLEASLKAIGAAWKSAPAAPREEMADEPANDLPVPPALTSSAAADMPRNAPTPLPAAAFADEEALGASLRAIGAALKSTPIPAPQEQAADSVANEVPPPPAPAAAAPADRPRNASLPTTPPAAGADEEAFFNQLRAIGTVLNSQPIKSSHKPLLSRVTDEVPFRRATEDAAPKRVTDETTFKRATDDVPFKRATEEVSLKRAADEVSFKPVSNPIPAPAPKLAPGPVPSTEAAERRWPAEPIRVTATVNADAAVDTPMFRSDLADSEDENAIWKKWMKAAPIGAALILVMIFLGFRLLSPGKPTLAKQSAEPQPAASADTVDFEPAASQGKPSSSAQHSTPKPSPATRMQPDQVGQPDAAAPASPSTPVDSQQMNDQLTAKPLIPQDVKEKVKEDAPPPEGPIAANNTEATDANAIGGVFSDQSRPRIAYVPYPRVTIASTVANGLLVKKTQPVYPPDAFYGGITGKVILEATVSRTGTVEDVRFVSGPHIFRQAALDAVKNWHYKPYTIDNVAREFQTTVDVAFDQKGGANPLALLHVGSHAKSDSTAAASTATNRSAGAEAGAP